MFSEYLSNKLWTTSNIFPSIFITLYHLFSFHSHLGVELERDRNFKSVHIYCKPLMKCKLKFKIINLKPYMANIFKGTSVLTKRTLNRSRDNFTALTYIQAVLEFSVNRTFVNYKFSALIRLTHTEFGLSYTINKQTFRALVQWRCKTEPRNIFCVN